MELEELKKIFIAVGIDTDRKVINALSIAQKVHNNQKRPFGDCPYLEDHIYPMTSNVVTHFAYSPRLKTLVIAALLHDVLEDSETAPEYLEKCVGKAPVAVVKLVTKNRYENEDGISQEEKYERNKMFLARMHDNLDAITIKLEDRLQNIQSFYTERIIIKPEIATRSVKEVRELFFPMTETKGLEVNYKKLLEIEADRVEKTLLSLAQ